MELEMWKRIHENIMNVFILMSLSRSRLVKLLKLVHLHSSIAINIVNTVNTYN